MVVEDCRVLFGGGGGGGEGRGGGGAGCRNLLKPFSGSGLRNHISCSF